MNFLHNLETSSKLLAAVALVLCLNLLQGLASLSHMHALDQASGALSGRWLPQTGAMLTLKADLQELRKLQRAVLDDKNDIDQDDKKLTVAMHDVRANVDQQARMLDDNGTPAQTAELRRLTGNFALDHARLAAKARDTMAQVVASVKHVNDIIGEIANASAEQTAGLDQVRHAIAAMGQATQQNAALAGQAASAAAAMKAEPARLGELVGAFPIVDSAPRPAGTMAAMEAALQRAAPANRQILVTRCPLGGAKSSTWSIRPTASASLAVRCRSE